LAVELQQGADALQGGVSVQDAVGAAGPAEAQVEHVVLGAQDVVGEFLNPAQGPCQEGGEDFLGTGVGCGLLPGDVWVGGERVCGQLGPVDPQQPGCAPHGAGMELRAALGGDVAGEVCEVVRAHGAEGGDAPRVGPFEKQLDFGEAAADGLQADVGLAVRVVVAE
jgi:hypothetical protein